MKLHRYIYPLLFTFLLIILLNFVIGNPIENQLQNDLIQIHEVSPIPQIDAKGDDECWQEVSWQAIDQVWIPYGTEVSSNDFSGRFKVGWSSSENLLYFLGEIVDDVFVDGYIFGKTADVYHFDIIEVFIDENKSGGLHVFDGIGDTGQQWGTNAENAFAYHIYADFPDDGKITTELCAHDLDGTDWSHVISSNYAEHFPEFALQKNQNQAIWEFSLIVYDETFENDNLDSARVQLTTGKMMGLSLAYCDNDDPNKQPKERDNFFGSVWVRKEVYNDHWMNADDFGVVQLSSNSDKSIKQ